MEFEPIESQEQFDSAIKERLERERSKVKEEYSEQIKKLNTSLEDLKKEQEKSQKDLQSLSDKETEIENLKKEVEGYKLSDLKTKIAVEKGLPYNLSDRLQGATEEELKSDAEKLAKFLKPTTAPPLKTLEGAKVDERTEAYRDLIKNLQK